MKRLSSLGRQRKHDTTAVVSESLARDQSPCGKRLHDTAQIAEIEAERRADLAGGRALARSQLEQHARLRKRERTLQQPLAQYADLARVEAVEAAQRLDLREVRIGGDWRSPFSQGGVWIDLLDLV